MDRQENAAGDGDPSYLAVGVISAIGIVAVSLGVSALFTPGTYESWVAFVGLTAVPAQLVIALLWHFEHPAFLMRVAQPVRGIVLLLLTAIAMLVGGAFLYFVPGHGAGITPMLINASIMTVVAAFWVVEVWRAWPLSVVFRNQIALGIAAWLFSFLIGYVAYETLFNFGFARHAPFYSVALDPMGLFNAWSALVFAVTTSGVIVVHEKVFDSWPVGGLKRPFLRGLIKTAVVVAATVLLAKVCLEGVHFELVDFMVRVPIALIFGVFLVTNLTQSRLFSAMRQPAKGLLLLVFVVCLGVAMEEFYRNAAPLLVRAPLPGGPPEYARELWVATALLSVTFPLIIVFTGCFGFWPLKRRPAKR